MMVLRFGWKPFGDCLSFLTEHRIVGRSFVYWGIFNSCSNRNSIWMGIEGVLVNESSLSGFVFCWKAETVSGGFLTKFWNYQITKSCPVFNPKKGRLPIAKS